MKFMQILVRNMMNAAKRLYGDGKLKKYINVNNAYFL